MIRDLKSLGLALAALLAVSAVTAAAAQAKPEFKADSYTAVVDGTAKSEHVFSFGEIQFACKQAIFQGELHAAATELTVTPSYSECRWIENPVRVTMNGCDFLLHSPEPSEEKGLYQGLFNIGCPAGKQVEIDMELFGALVCRLTVPAQANVESVDFVDNANKEGSSDDDLTTNFTIAGIHYVMDAGFSCPVKSGAYANLSYKGTSTATGTNKEGKQIGIRVE